MQFLSLTTRHDDPVYVNPLAITSFGPYQWQETAKDGPMHGKQIKWQGSMIHFNDGQLSVIVREPSSTLIAYLESL